MATVATFFVFRQFKWFNTEWMTEEDLTYEFDEELLDRIHETIASLTTIYIFNVIAQDYCLILAVRLKLQYLCYSFSSLIGPVFSFLIMFMYKMEVNIVPTYEFTNSTSFNQTLVDLCCSARVSDSFVSDCDGFDVGLNFTHYEVNPKTKNNEQYTTVIRDMMSTYLNTTNNLNETTLSNTTIGQASNATFGFPVARQNNTFDNFTTITPTNGDVGFLFEFDIYYYFLTLLRNAIYNILFLLTSCTKYHF